MGLVSYAAGRTGDCLLIRRSCPMLGVTCRVGAADCVRVVCWSARASRWRAGTLRFGVRGCWPLAAVAASREMAVASKNALGRATEKPFAQSARKAKASSASAASPSPLPSGWGYYRQVAPVAPAKVIGCHGLSNCFSANAGEGLVEGSIPRWHAQERSDGRGNECLISNSSHRQSHSRSISTPFVPQGRATPGLFMFVGVPSPGLCHPSFALLRVCRPSHTKSLRLAPAW